MQHREKSFYKGFFIYTVGNLGSKFINTILFPIFSFYILQDQMGIFDLSIVVVYLLIPIFTLNIRESTIRFLIDPQYQSERSTIIRFILKNLTRGILFTILLMSIAQLIHPIPYFGWILGSLITYMAYEIIVQIARGIGQTKLFIISGILSTFLTASISIALVIGFKMDIQAVFFANIIARIFCIILIEYRIHFLKEFFNSATQSAEINKIMLRYALPLLPNFILFWFIDNSSRIFINQYLGIEQNGLYAIIIKFPNILLTFSFIFYQTWQEMAIKFYDSPDRNQFFSNIFNQYAIGLSLAVVMIGFGIKSIFPFIVDSKYQVGIIYIYPLLVAVVFNSLAFFMDMSYQCSKQSSKSLPSIISTAILSVFLNYILVKHFGMMGVVYALILSYIFLTIFRVVDSRKIIPISIKKESIFAILILISGWFLNITPMKSYLSITIAMISFCVFTFIFGKPLLSNFLKK